jgi:hypothetical protein
MIKLSIQFTIKYFFHNKSCNLIKGLQDLEWTLNNLTTFSFMRKRILEINSFQEFRLYRNDIFIYFMLTLEKLIIRYSIISS